MNPLEEGDVLFLRTSDYSRFNPLQISIGGRHILTDRGRPNEYLYFTEQETKSRIRFQTRPINHFGPIEQHGQLVFPINQNVEEDLHDRILHLESAAEEQVVNYLSLSKPPSFFTEAAQSAYEARCRINNLQQSEESQKHYNEVPYLQEHAKVVRSAYSNDTLWLRLADKCMVFGPEGEPIEGDFEKILGRGRYEFLIRASVVFLDKRPKYGIDDYTFASLILRVCQIRYKAHSEQDTSICCFQPVYKDPEQQQPSHDEVQCKSESTDGQQSPPDSDPSDQPINPSDSSPWLSTNLKDWIDIINGDVQYPLLPRAMSPKTPPTTPSDQTPLSTCATLIDLTDSQDTVFDSWPVSQIPLPDGEPSRKKTCNKKSPLTRKRRQEIDLTF